MSTRNTHKPVFQIAQDQDFEGIANYRVSFQLRPNDTWTIDNQAGTIAEAKARQTALEAIFASDGTPDRESGAIDEKIGD